MLYHYFLCQDVKIVKLQRAVKFYKHPAKGVNLDMLLSDVKMSKSLLFCSKRECNNHMEI